MLATGRLYHATFLSNSTFLLCRHMLLLSELKSAELWVLWTVYWPTGLTGSVFVIHLTTWRDAKTTVLRARFRDEPCTPDFPILIRWVVCGTSTTQTTRKMIWKNSVSCFVFFPTLGKARKLNLRKWSAFMLIRQNVIERISVVLTLIYFCM